MFTGIAATSYDEYEIDLIDHDVDMSSEHGVGKGFYAVDGNTETDFYQHPCAHNAGDETNPWWSVDMGHVESVLRIRILNREDCCREFYKSMD